MWEAGKDCNDPIFHVGNGIYKSTDGGKNWMHLGLADAQQIGGMAIDPKNENRVVCCGTRPSLWTQYGAWCLPNNRWRKDMGKSFIYR